MVRDFPESTEAARWRQALAGVSLTFAILPSILYILRIAALRRVSRKPRADDVLMGFAVVLLWGSTAAALMKAFNGIGVAQELMPAYRAERMTLGSWLMAKFWASSMCFTKLSIILFLRTVVGVSQPTRIILDAVAICTICWACMHFLCTTFFCYPVTYYWNKSTPGGWCMDSNRWIIEDVITGALALIGNVLILMVPMPLIWRLQTDFRRKVAVIVIFGFGGLACIFSLLRVVQSVYSDPTRLSTSSNLETLWTLLENDFAIFCGCLPQLGPLLPGYFDNSAHSNLGGSHSRAYDAYGEFGNSEAANSRAFRKFGKMGVIKTTVVSTDTTHNGSRGHGEGECKVFTCAGRRISRTKSIKIHGRSSSEIELQGIAVQTTMKQEISVETDSGSDSGRH